MLNKAGAKKQQAKSVRKSLSLLALSLVVSFFLSSCTAIESALDIIDDKAELSESSDALNQAEPIVSTKTGSDERPRHFSVQEAARRTETNEKGLEPLSTIEIAAKAQPTVVAINTTGIVSTWLGDLPADGAGSGVIISEDGYIVTNNHVIDKADDINVVLATGETYSAKLIGTAPNNDLAVIKIDATGLPYAEFANSDELIVGELAVAVGNPLGDFQGTVTSGIVSSLGRTLVLQQKDGSLIELNNLIQTDAAINNGNSGGGLFNSYGELIGINVAKAGSQRQGVSVEGLGFAIPANTAAPIINSLVNEGHISGEPSLEILAMDVTAEMAQSYPDRLVEGVWIRQMSQDSPLAEAGLLVGDIIVGLADEEVHNVAELNLVKNRYRAGDKVSIKYYRAGKYYEAEIVLAEAQNFSDN